MSPAKELKNKPWYSFLLVIFVLILVFTAYAPFYRGLGDLNSKITDSVIGVVLNATILIVIWKIVLYVLNKPKKPTMKSVDITQNQLVKKEIKEKNDKQNKVTKPNSNNTVKMIIEAIIALSMLGFAFYWFSYRPEQIRKDCYKKAYGIVIDFPNLAESEAKFLGVTVKEFMESKETNYLKCVRSFGLE